MHKYRNNINISIVEYRKTFLNTIYAIMTDK